MCATQRERRERESRGKQTGGATILVRLGGGEREAIGKTAKEKVIIYFETKSNRKNIVIADVE